MSADRVTRIETLLTEAFQPSHLDVVDQSHLHVGHAGAKDGKGHFQVTIVAERFAGEPRIARHRLVYEALGPTMASDIHALSIRAYAPGEAGPP